MVTYSQPPFLSRIHQFRWKAPSRPEVLSWVLQKQASRFWAIEIRNSEMIAVNLARQRRWSRQSWRYVDSNRFTYGQGDISWPDDDSTRHICAPVSSRVLHLCSSMLYSFVFVSPRIQRARAAARTDYTAVASGDRALPSTVLQVRRSANKITVPNWTALDITEVHSRCSPWE